MNLERNKAGHDSRECSTCSCTDTPGRVELTDYHLLDSFLQHHRLSIDCDVEKAHAEHHYGLKEKENETIWCPCQAHNRKNYKNA